MSEATTYTKEQYDNLKVKAQQGMVTTEDLILIPLPQYHTQPLVSLALACTNDTI